MLSFIRPQDNVWDVPVVLLCVWTVVLVVASLIVLSCLQKETQKFGKRLTKADSKVDIVIGIANLDSIMAKYIQQLLGQGVLERLAKSYADDQQESKLEALRAEAKEWFAAKVSELTEMKLPEKVVKQTILSAIRTGLTRHPLDLRGSRRALEAAKIFLEVDVRKEKMSLFDASLIMGTKSLKSDSTTIICPTIPCQWMTSKFLEFLSFLVSHPNTIPLFFILLSFTIWLYDSITDMVIIHLLWNFRLPIMYPVNGSWIGEEMTYLSYQTLTTDLYAPLLLLILLFSLMSTLLSCSYSCLSESYKLTTMYATPQYELTRQSMQDHTTILGRYDFQLSQAVTASLPQFCLQFGSYMVILYMLETLKGLSVDKATQDTVQEKIDSFPLSSLWFSGLGSALSLIVAQYTALKIQHEHDLTLGQRVIYFFSCIFNTTAMMTSTVTFISVVLLPVSTYIGRYHIMILVILFAAILGLGTIISVILVFFGMDPYTITTDRVITRFQTKNLLSSFLWFGKSDAGQWSLLLGATTLIDKLFSLITINLFLPPSQLLIHPFCKFYSTSPRSPALHYAIAKQLIYYNILLITSSILLCVDINEYGFNYNISLATRNLLIFANFTCVPCIFMALLLLFKFYSSFDIWTSNGVHLVFQQDLPSIIGCPEACNEDSSDQSNISLLKTDEEYDEETESMMEEGNKSTDTSHTKQKKKISFCSVADIAIVDVHGKWVNVSD